MRLFLHQKVKGHTHQLSLCIFALNAFKGKSQSKHIPAPFIGDSGALSVSCIEQDGYGTVSGADAVGVWHGIMCFIGFAWDGEAYVCALYTARLGIFQTSTLSVFQRVAHKGLASDTSGMCSTHE